MAKYRVTLSADERGWLEQLVAVGKAAARKLGHARILLLADTSQGEERSDEDIADSLGISGATIARVRQRLVTQGLEAALSPKPQPPRPDKVKIKGDVEQQLVRLACSDPPQGRCRWTLHLLADELVALGLVAAVSGESVRQALKKTTSGPRSSRSGASRRRPTPSLSGAWRTGSPPTNCPTIRSTP
jgi:transposase